MGEADRVWREGKVGYGTGSADQLRPSAAQDELWTKPGMTRGSAQMVSAKLPARSWLGYLISQNHLCRPPTGTQSEVRLTSSVPYYNGLNTG